MLPPGVEPRFNLVMPLRHAISSFLHLQRPSVTPENSDTPALYISLEIHTAPELYPRLSLPPTPNIK